MKKMLKISLWITSILVMLLLFVLLVMNNTKVHNYRDNESSIIEITVEGQKVDSEQSPAGVATEFELLLEMDLTNNQEVVFYVSHQWTEVFIGDELVYCLEQSSELPFIKTPGSQWVRIPIYADDEGKCIRVLTTPSYEDHLKKEIEFFIGSSLAIYRAQLEETFPIILLSTLNILVGMILLFAAVYYRKVERKDSELIPLGLIGITIGFWRLAHNDFSPYLLEGKEIFLYYLSVTMMIVCVLPLICAASGILSANKKKMLQYYMLIVSVVASLQIVLQIIGIKDLREMFPITHGSILIGAVMLIGVIIADRIGKNKETNKKSYIWVLALGLIGDLILYYFDDSASNLIMITSAILLFMLLEGFSLLKAYFEQKTALEEKEEQLNHSRMVISMSQIRSHFVFNILNAISGMCKYNPEKADETIVRFSRYLRNNIDIMEEDKMIPFEIELQRLEDYIILEQIRFEERLEFVTDLEVTDFMIPSLILQPVIENSIKHGISKKKTGGTILLSTWEEDDKIMISVDDDGIGFEMEELEKSASVGLKNIRFRLEHLMNGTLTIKSEIGKGTRTIISFPAKKEESNAYYLY